VNALIRTFTAALLLFFCGGCANQYFAWNQPLPVDQEHGFLQTSSNYDVAPFSNVPWPHSDYSRSDAMKDFCRTLEKQGFKCPTPARAH
jgi:hypothetical protein